MDEIISMIIANGLWAVLFCMLLVYELRDSRKREGCYTGTIEILTERLAAVNAVKADVSDVKDCVIAVRSDTADIKSACRRCGGKEKVAKGGAVCAETTA